MADGTILVGGGTSIEDVEDDPCAAMAYRFDPSTGAGGSWTDVEPMPASIISAGAVLLKDGRVLVTGGTGSDGATSLALAYSPSNDEWTTLTPAPTGAFAPLVLRLLDGRVLVSGGYTLTEIDGTEHDDSAATYLYNPANDTWASTTSVGGHGMAGVVLSDGRVAVAGGDRNASNGSHHALSTTVRLLDPTTGTWTTPAALRTARASFTLVQLPNGQLLAAGGKTPNGTSSTVDVYDWLTNAWYSAANLQGGRAMHGSAVLNDGGVLVAGGATASAEVYRLGDITPPVTATPVARLRTATTLSYPSVPARITWSAQDAGGAGVGTYDVARSTDGGAYSTVGSTWTSTSFSTTVSVGHTYTFRVRARDWAGNVGAWKVAAIVKPAVTQQTSSHVTYSGTWSTGSTSKYTGGTVKYATAAGASATYSFTGRSIAWVTTKATRSGSARIYIDGVLASTMSLYASSYTYKYVAFEMSWTTSGAHTIKVEVVGTSGHPRIDIDAFLVLVNG
jgi:hypothetical protein